MTLSIWAPRSVCGSVPVLVIALACCLGDEPSAAAPAGITQNGPAYIGVKVALARSGPGLEHYATEALVVGDLVEVLELQDGWAAIRPTVDAYSWIAADQLRTLASSQSTGKAEVTAESAKAWLGSEVEQVSKHVSQVQLRRREIVEVIGQKEVTLSSGATEVWAKVRPPIGERRWVRLTDLRDTPPLHPSRGVQPPAVASSAPSDEVWSDRRHRQRSTDILAESLPSERADHNPSRSSFINARERIKRFDDEVARLQLALTRAAAATTSSGALVELQEEIDDLHGTGRTALERGEASRLRESIDELLELAEKREELGLDNDTGSPDSDGDSSKRQLTPFQVKGWLMPVAWYGRPTEMCAIMNDEHMPIAFVTPAPGVNLRRYSNKKVGIIGEEGYPIRDTRRVVAHRVVELSRHEDEAAARTFENAPWVQFQTKAED